MKIHVVSVRLDEREFKVRVRTIDVTENNKTYVRADGDSSLIAPKNIKKSKFMSPQNIFFDSAKSIHRYSFCLQDNLSECIKMLREAVEKAFQHQYDMVVSTKAQIDLNKGKHLTIEIDKDR